MVRTRRVFSSHNALARKALQRCSQYQGCRRQSLPRKDHLLEGRSIRQFMTPAGSSLAGKCCHTLEVSLDLGRWHVVLAVVALMPMPAQPMMNRRVYPPFGGNPARAAGAVHDFWVRPRRLALPAVCPKDLACLEGLALHRSP